MGFGSGFLAVLIAAGTLTTPAESAAEQYMHDFQRQIQAPGLAWAVIRGDQVVQRGAWGRDGDGAPMTTGTPFLLGSTSKSFTALAVAQLAEQKRVDLDGTAVTYLPWLRLGDTTPAVTVRQLLTHTSGLPQVWSESLTDRYDNSPGGLRRSVRDLAELPVHEQRYEYSDANYMILGALVEQVTDSTFGDYLQRHVFDPLDMRDAAATEADVPPGHRYYLGRPQRFESRFDTAGAPYGFLAASLDDLSKYTIAQLNGSPVLGPEAMRQMHTGTVGTGHGTYGFGWQNSTLDGIGTPIVWHAGATPDYFTHIVLAPEKDLAVVVMANVYGLPQDGVLSSGAFNLARIVQGGTAQAATEDPIHVQALSGLLGIAALLTVLLWFAAHGRGPVLAWLLGCAAVAAVAGWLVPSFWKGAGLAKLQLWAPDIGHAIILVLVLSGVVAATRVAVKVVQL